MTLEQMKKILDSAPDWAAHYDRAENQYYPSSEPFVKGNILLDDLRTELAKHDTLDLEPADIPHGCIVLEK